MTKERLREIFDCDPDTGVIKWKKSRPGIRKNHIAGGVCANGYITVSVDMKRTTAHRIMWIYHNGEIPDGLCIDHINGIKSDNRLSNIRLATQKENRRNVKEVLGEIPFKGVFAVGKRYRARITKNYKDIHIGYYDTPEDAAAAYDEAAIFHFGNFAVTNKSLGLI